MHRMFATVLLILLAPVARADDEDTAVKAVEKLGGTVKRNAKGVVTHVILRGKKVTDAELKALG